MLLPKPALVGELFQTRLQLLHSLGMLGCQIGRLVRVLLDVVELIPDELEVSPANGSGAAVPMGLDVVGGRSPCYRPKRRWRCW